MTNPLTKQLPQRFSEASFRRWERIIETAVELLPSRLVLPPRMEYTQETVSCGVRNAMRSLYEHGWNTTVDVLKFNDYYLKIEVARDGEDVIIQLKQRRPQQVDQTPPSTIVINTPTNDELKSAIILRANQRIAPVLFTGVTEDQKLDMIEIEKCNKVAFNFQETGILMV
jgi:hypothetical protein